MSSFSLSICLCFWTWLVFLSARLTLPYYLILTTAPLPTSRVHLPIKLHFFLSHKFQKGFLWFPISSVSFSHPSSTCWHAFYRSPSRLSHLYSSYPCWLILGLSDHLRKGVKSEIPSTTFLSQVAGKLCSLQSDCSCYFLQLYFSMSSRPNWDNSNLFWQPSHKDKLLMDGDGCRTAPRRCLLLNSQRCV